MIETVRRTNVCEGARVIVACRNELAGLRVCQEITADTGNSDVHFRPLDLASLTSVRRFADQLIHCKLLHTTTALFTT